MNASPSIRLFWASGVDEEARCLFSYYLKIPPSHPALCRDRLSEQASTPDFLESFLPFHRVYYLHEHTAKTIEAHTLTGA